MEFDFYEHLGKVDKKFEGYSVGDWFLSEFVKKNCGYIKWVEWFFYN